MLLEMWNYYIHLVKMRLLNDGEISGNEGLKILWNILGKGGLSRLHTDVLLGLLKNVQKARLKTFKNSHNNDGTLLYKDNGAQAISFLKQCQGSKFPPLKLIVMSAAWMHWFLRSLWWCKSWSHPGATSIYGPVDMFYTHHAEPDYLDAALNHHVPGIYIALVFCLD